MEFIVASMDVFDFGKRMTTMEDRIKNTLSWVLCLSSALFITLGGLRAYHGGEMDQIDEIALVYLITGMVFVAAPLWLPLLLNITGISALGVDIKLAPQSNTATATTYSAPSPPPLHVSGRYKKIGAFIATVFITVSVSFILSPELATEIAIPSLSISPESDKSESPKGLGVPAVIPASSAKGKILSPRDNESVRSGFEAKGSVENIPPGFHLWLAVKISGSYWPKGPMKISGNTWSCKVYEGTPDPFALTLYLVDSQANKKILNWFEEGKKTGDYPAINEIANGQLLDSVQLELKH